MPSRAPLTDRDVVIIAAIATGATQRMAAEIAGCSERTVRKRLATPEVKRSLEVERQRLAEEVADALTGALPCAVRRLVCISSAGADRDAMGAARVLLTEARAWRDAVYVSERLVELEAALLDRRH